MQIIYWGVVGIFGAGIWAAHIYALLTGEDGGPEYDNRDWSGW